MLCAGELKHVVVQTDDKFIAMVSEDDFYTAE